MIFLNIILTAVITIASFFAIENYVPLKYLETKQEKKLGTSITTIASTDTLKNSRTTINDNFTALNNGKIEISTTTLPLITTLSGLTSASALATVGTITSGTWSGTAILTAKGGTGSTTLAANQVLLGNGTGNIGIVAGLGTTGQYLTSTGAGTAPTWQTSAVDTAINYTWTGLHSFTGGLLATASSTLTATTTILANSATNNALVLNGVNYKFPSTQGASSTVLATDGSGSLTWNVPPNAFSFGATTTSAGAVASITYPHNLGRVPVMIKLELYSTTIATSDTVAVHILGQATSTAASQTCIYLAENLTANTVFQALCGAGDILRVDSPGGGGGNTRIQAQLTGLTATNFTLNWSDNDSAAGNLDRVILYTVY